MLTVCEPECESSPPNASSPPSAAAPSAKSGDSVEEKAQVQARLKAYRESAEELLVHFQDKVRRIDGAQPPDAVFGAISACLGRAPARTVVEVPPPRRGRTVAVVTPPCGAQRFPCERIADKLGLVHVSAGKLLVKHMQRETAAGMKTKEYIDRQERVPSELIVSLFKERMNKKDARQRGCLLDGFPLSPDHAEAMKGQIEVDSLFLVEVPDEDHIESLVNRRVDPKTGIVYTLKSSPPPAKVMKRVVQSGYDTEEKVRARLKQYHASVDAILPYFEGKVRRIDGTQQKDVLIDAIRGAVAGRPEEARREDATRHRPKPRGAMRSVAKGAPLARGLRRQVVVRRSGSCLEFLNVQAECEVSARQVAKQDRDGLARRTRGMVMLGMQLPAEVSAGSRPLRIACICQPHNRVDEFRRRLSLRNRWYPPLVE